VGAEEPDVQRDAAPLEVLEVASDARPGEVPLEVDGRHTVEVEALGREVAAAVDGGEPEAAVAADEGRDPLPHERLEERRVLGRVDVQVRVRVDVDEARAGDPPPGVDDPLGARAVRGADRGDPVALDEELARKGGAPGAVDDPGVLDEDGCALHGSPSRGDYDTARLDVNGGSGTSLPDCESPGFMLSSRS
jgi:hypothetical protein